MNSTLIPPAAGEAAHTLQSCNLVGMRADRSSSRRNPGMASPFFADIVTDTDLLAHVRGDSYAEAEARRAFIVTACSTHHKLMELARSVLAHYERKAGSGLCEVNANDYEIASAAWRASRNL
jgi:hypothetical protein